MARLMILGAGPQQLSAIRTALAFGHEVVAVDGNRAAPGLAEASHGVHLDFCNAEATTDLAVKLRIQGVLTVASDRPVQTIGRICDRLGLPGPTGEVAVACTDKRVMRAALGRAGVMIPDGRAVATFAECEAAARELGFPLIVKPADNSGGRGVVKVANWAGLAAGYATAHAFSHGGGTCVEQFVSGTEFGAQVVVFRGRVAAVFCHNDTLTPPPVFVPVGHSMPFEREPALYRRVVEVLEGAVAALGITDGAANFDLIESPTGIVVLEVGARLGGTGLPDLIRASTGVDVVRAVIQIALRQEPDLVPVVNLATADLVLTSAESGTLRRITVPDLDNDPHLLHYTIDVRPGDAVRTFASGADRLGQLLTRGATVVDAEAHARRIAGGICFEIE